MRFKVGDKVRLVNDLPFNPKARGKIAEITSTDELYYLLGSIEGFDGGQVCLYDDEHLLELVESAKILPHQM